MIQYLVFPNGTASTSLQKDVIVNWSNVKYMKIDGLELVLELNNGGSIRLSMTNFGSGLDAAVQVMETVQDLVKSNPNGKVLKVKPDFFKQWGMVNIVYTAPTDGVGIDGSGVQYAVPVFTGTKTITNLPLGTAGQVLTSGGAGVDPSWTTIASGGVNGSNSVYVKPTGTASANGVLLLAGLTDAISKIVTTTVPGSNITMSFYNPTGLPGQYEGFAQNPVSFSSGPQYSATFDGSAVLITVTSVGNQGPDTFEFEITDTGGSPFNIVGTPDFPTPATTSTTPATLIIAPGDYSIASDFILNNLVNVTSLTGQADVNITTSNVKIQSGANSSSNPISIVGLNLVDKSIYVESNLSFVSFKNCTALGANSFSIEPSGTGSISSRFENCIGAFRSFGGGVGVTASGLFIRCKVASGITNGGAFGGKGNTSGRFEYCGGASTGDSSGTLFIPGNMFCQEGVTCGGFFYYCIGRSASFASNNTGATTANFYNCVGGNQSFAYRNTNNSGQFYNCVANDNGNQAFGSNPQGGDLASNARYVNCSSDGSIAQAAAAISSRFYNCHARLSWNGYSAGANGLAYNCSFGSGTPSQGSVSSNGKYRNCLDNNFALVNEG